MSDGMKEMSVRSGRGWRKEEGKGEGRKKAKKEKVPTPHFSSIFNFKKKPKKKEKIQK
jgi:hypothetical protein